MSGTRCIPFYLYQKQRALQYIKHEFHQHFRLTVKLTDHVDVHQKQIKLNLYQYVRASPKCAASNQVTYKSNLKYVLI